MAITYLEPNTTTTTMTTAITMTAQDEFPQRVITPTNDDSDSGDDDSTSCCSKKRRLIDNFSFEVSETNTSNKKQRTNKRVHFSMETDHDVESTPVTTEIRIVPRVAEEDIPQVWFSHDDFQYTRYHDAQWIHYYRHLDDYHPHIMDTEVENHEQLKEQHGPHFTYKQDLLQVLGAACGKHLSASDDGVEAATFALADSAMRGLEREMSPCFRQRKKQVVANVLTSQQALVQWRNNNSKLDAKAAYKYTAKILGTHYRKLAQPACTFAQLLGQGDALWVEQQAQEQR